LTLDCQSQSNPPNWIAILIEQSSNPIQQYPADRRILDWLEPGLFGFIEF